MKTFAAAIVLIAAPISAAWGQNWLTTVAPTEAGHRIGNPKAKVKLIEFVSYTCPHCGEFAREGDPALKAALVQRGTGSVEIRHVIRDVIDLTATVLVNCGPRSKFAGNHELFFARQGKWLSAAQFALPSQRRRWQSGPQQQRLQAVAGDLGFYDIMATRGYSRTEVDRCLSDGEAISALAARAEAGANAYNVNSTPSFVLNGKLLEGVHTWEDLRKAL